LKISYC